MNSKDFHFEALEFYQIQSVFFAYLNPHTTIILSLFQRYIGLENSFSSKSKWCLWLVKKYPVGCVCLGWSL